MTMVVRTPMLIFINASNTYPVYGLEDNINHVTYRTRRKDWMDQRLFHKYFQEPCTF